MDELMALPYLDAVVRETLRVHSPVPTAERIAMKDDVLPLEKPYTDTNGEIRDFIRYTYGPYCETSVYSYPPAQYQERRPGHYSHPGSQPVAGVVGT